MSSVSFVGLEEPLKLIFERYPSSSMMCDLCASQVVRLLTKVGFAWVDIVKIENQEMDGIRAPYMMVKDAQLGMRSIGITGFHEVVKLQEAQDSVYIDALVYENYGVQAISWADYVQLWAYPFIEQTSVRES